jgi:hypothetical protein
MYLAAAGWNMEPATAGPPDRSRAIATPDFLDIGEQATRREATDPVVVVRHCLAGDRYGFKATPITTLFLYGRSTPVDDYLCHVDAFDYEEPTARGNWWLLSTTRSGVRGTRIGRNRFEGYAIGDFLPSPDGKYLAVLSYAEGAPSIEVVDLVEFVRRKTFKPVRSLPVGLGTVSLKAWSGGALQVASDTLFIGLPDRMELVVHAEEVFSWDVRSGTVVPVSEALRNPVRYYCSFLESLDPSQRSSGAWGLRLLNDRSAVPCIEAALKENPEDGDVKATLSHILAERSPARSTGRHVTVSGAGAERQLTLFGDTARVLKRASIPVPDDIAPESIERGLKNVVWDRDGLCAALAFERAQGTFVVAFVTDKDFSSVVASDISRTELANIAAIGPSRVYVKRRTRPDWRTSRGGHTLIVRTEAWDASGRRYAGQDLLKFDDNGRPIWR